MRLRWVFFFFMIFLDVFVKKFIVWIICLSFNVWGLGSWINFILLKDLVWLIMLFRGWIIKWRVYVFIIFEKIFIRDKLKMSCWVVCYIDVMVKLVLVLIYIVLYWFYFLLIWVIFGLIFGEKLFVNYLGVFLFNCILWVWVDIILLFVFWSIIVV